MNAICPWFVMIDVFIKINPILKVLERCTIKIVYIRTLGCFYKRDLVDDKNILRTHLKRMLVWDEFNDKFIHLSSFKQTLKTY